MKLYNYIEFIKESTELMPGAIGEKKFKVTGYRTWDEARPEGYVEADDIEEVEHNFGKYEDFLVTQDKRFKGADLEEIEEIPNNT